MSNLNTIENNKQNQKDNIKGQKIVAALYLVTHHLSDTDPIKTTLRALGVSLIQASADMITTIANRISTLLNAATLAHLISEKNTSILSLEVGHYASSGSTDDILEEYFTEKPLLPKRTYQGHLGSVQGHRSVRHTELFKKNESVSNKYENKDKRQNDILSFINIRKAVGIKDIATLFPSVSEKTIQRELMALVSSGRITKRGSKRWSVYMAI